MQELSVIGNHDRARSDQPLILQALYPTHFGVFVRAAEEWSDSPDVTTSLMKFMMEFVYNKVTISFAFRNSLVRSDTILGRELWLLLLVLCRPFTFFRAFFLDRGCCLDTHIL